MTGKVLSIEDAKKLADYNKIYEENVMLKSDNFILKNKSKENDKKYLKIITERNNRIKELEEENFKLKNKQVNIFKKE